MRIQYLAIIALVLLTAAPSSAEYTPIFHITGPTSTSYLGGYIGTCGDRNGDGCDEFLISNQNPEEVMMFYGGANLDTIPDMIFGIGRGKPRCITYGENMRSNEHGEILITQILNGYTTIYMYDSGNQLDTIPDMIIHSEGLTYDDGFGIPVVIGDVNGDGWNDIVAAAPSYHEFGSMEDNGKLYVFHGGTDIDSIPDFTITAAYNDFGDRLGVGLDCGDVNGDGYADILIQTASGPNMTYLFYGGAELDSIPDWSYMPDSPAYLIDGCHFIPKLNGDNYDDFVLEANFIGSGTLVFFGGEALSSDPDQMPNTSVYIPFLVGNINGDIYDDMTSNGSVGIRILYGSSTGIVLGPIISTNPYTPVPMGIGRCGDVNGDGFEDVAFSVQEPVHNQQFFIYADTTLNAIIPFPEPQISVFTLYQNYPNPFNSSTIISFELKSKQRIELNVYNLLGKKVTELSNSEYEAGIHTIKWNAEGVPSGIYFIQFKCGEQNEIKKLLLIR